MTNNEQPTMDYELRLKVKNARLLNVMRQQGYETAAQLAKASETSQSDIGKMLNLKCSAYNKKGELRVNVARVCECLGELPENIFPERLLFESVDNNEFSRQVTEDQFRLGSEPNNNPEALISDMQADLSALDDGFGLSDKELKVLRMRFSEEMTLEECGIEFGVTRARIRQIEMRALRKLRHPKHHERLLDLGGTYSPTED